MTENQFNQETSMPNDPAGNFYLLLGRIEGKIDALMTWRAENARVLEGHEKRISILEQGKARILGAVGVIVIGIEILGRLFHL
jgi:hypothetical protein